MTPERWQAIKGALNAALELEPGQRPAYLDGACASDQSLRQEVQALLDSGDDIRSSFLQSPPRPGPQDFDAIARSTLPEAPLPGATVESLLAAHGDSMDLSQGPGTVEPTELEAQPQIIGPYHLLKELGLGGMGQVWLAKQTEPVKRQVALKLIRAGMYDPSTVQRFKAERQSLAIMDHPAIAKVFDAGTTAAGQPYFVMEYVKGLPLTDYCDGKKLGIRDRLQLFMRVCEGVQHAHQKAIIHRDLKPSNILVAEVDGKLAPRIIDFGLAKAAAPLVPGETRFTQRGAFLGTLGYMSPEQADPALYDIDTRTDVYSLGVVLYELLTGFLPFDTKDLKKKRPAEFLRQLHEDDPPRPSTRVSSSREESASKAEVRRVEPQQLIGLLRGDLDWITLKAIERDRERRYPTPLALASDLQNYLEHRPVMARAASLGYRVRKYVRRHAAGVAVASVVVALLMAFAVIQAIQLRRITRERDRADRITEFMTNMFKVSDPGEARGNTITAREILDKSANEIHTGLAQDPGLRAEMLHVMGTVYLKLGLYSRADSILREAVETRKRMLGLENPKTLESSGQWALALEDGGHHAEAEKLERKLLATEQRVLGPGHRTTLQTMSVLSWTLDSEGHDDEALAFARKTLVAQQRLFGKEDPDTLLSARRLAGILNSSGHYPEAEALFRETSEVHRKLLGAEHPETLAAMGDLGFVLVNENRNAEAEAVLRSTLEAQRRILGKDHENTLATMNSLANALANQHQYAEAEKLYRESYESAARILGKKHRYTLGVLSNLAGLLQDQGHYREAERLDREILAMRLRALGPDHPDTATAMFNIGDALRGEGRYVEAEKIFRDTIVLDTRVLGANHPDTLDSLYNLAAVLALERRNDDALATLSRAVGAGLPAEDAAKIETDAAFNSLHKNPEFMGLVGQAKQRVTAAAAKKP